MIRMKWKTITVLTLALLAAFCLCSDNVLATNTGSTHAMEVMVGAKNSGAPSQQLAGRMGLLINGLKEMKGKHFLGKVSDPAPLLKHGFTGVKAGDLVSFVKTGDLTYKITLPQRKQAREFKVKFSK